MRIFVGIGTDEEHRQLRRLGRENVERIVEGSIVAAQRQGGDAGRRLCHPNDARLAGGNVNVDRQSTLGRPLPAKLKLLVFGFSGIGHPHAQGDLSPGLSLSSLSESHCAAAFSCACADTGSTVTLMPRGHW